MNETFRREMIYLWYYFSIQFRQIFPYWVLGMAAGSAISVFLKESIHSMLHSFAGKRRGMEGIMIASALGIASPLCMYGTIPVAASFSKLKVADDWLAAFMMSSILLNPQLLIYSAALGKMALIVRLVSCFLCGICAGIFVKIFYRKQAFFDFRGFKEAESKDTDPDLFLRFVKNIGRNVKATGVYFLMGIVLSALFQRYVPAGWLTSLSGGNEAFGVLMAATVGVPLYACGGGTIPLLQAWLTDGMSMGSAAAFMVTGPSTKITNLGALKIVLGIRRFCLYIGYVMIFSLLTGIIVDMIF